MAPRFSTGQATSSISMEVPVPHKRSGDKLTLKDSRIDNVPGSS